MRRTIFMGSLLLALAPTVMAAQVYKWVDAQGITHFGAQPPEGVEASNVNTKHCPAQDEVPAARRPEASTSLQYGRQAEGRRRESEAGSRAAGSRSRPALYAASGEPGAAQEQPARSRGRKRTGSAHHRRGTSGADRKKREGHPRELQLTLLESAQASPAISRSNSPSASSNPRIRSPSLT